MIARYACPEMISVGHARVGLHLAAWRKGHGEDPPQLS
jgi:hypothetical protein